jgi:hypothetical protein
MAELLQSLILYGFVGMLLLLRFDAPRFGAADADDEEATGLRDWIVRLSWYAFALGLIGLIYWMHPRPISQLRLQVGSNFGEVLAAGVAIAAIGAFVAVLYTWLRYREIRLPAVRRYPAGLLTCVGTALIDEAVFRGIVLGLLLAAEWPVELAIGFQAVLYVLATRLAGRDRPIGLVLVFLGLALVTAWVTIETAGIGAAVLGHALMRFTMFVVTGHAGALRDVTTEYDEALDASELTPEGWEIVPDRDQGSGYRW